MCLPVTASTGKDGTMYVHASVQKKKKKPVGQQLCVLSEAIIFLVKVTSFVSITISLHMSPDSTPGAQGYILRE